MNTGLLTLHFLCWTLCCCVGSVRGADGVDQTRISLQEYATTAQNTQEVISLELRLLDTLGPTRLVSAIPDVYGPADETPGKRRLLHLFAFAASKLPPDSLPKELEGQDLSGRLSAMLASSRSAMNKALVAFCSASILQPVAALPLIDEAKRQIFRETQHVVFPDDFLQEEERLDALVLVVEAYLSLRTETSVNRALETSRSYAVWLAQQESRQEHDGIRELLWSSVTKRYAVAFSVATGVLRKRDDWETNLAMYGKLLPQMATASEGFSIQGLRNLHRMHVEDLKPLPPGEQIMLAQSLAFLTSPRSRVGDRHSDIEMKLSIGETGFAERFVEFVNEALVARGVQLGTTTSEARPEAGAGHSTPSEAHNP